MLNPDLCAVANGRYKTLACLFDRVWSPEFAHLSLGRLAMPEDFALCDSKVDRRIFDAMKVRAQEVARGRSPLELIGALVSQRRVGSRRLPLENYRLRFAARCYRQSGWPNAQVVYVSRTQLEAELNPGWRTERSWIQLPALDEDRTSWEHVRELRARYEATRTTVRHCLAVKKDAREIEAQYLKAREASKQIVGEVGRTATLCLVLALLPDSGVAELEAARWPLLLLGQYRRRVLSGDRERKLNHVGFFLDQENRR